MKIAIVSTPFVSVPPADYGGTELVVHQLVEGLSERGHEVVLFATGDSRSRGELRFLYEHAQWPPGIMTDLNHVSWAFQQIGEEEFDIVHVHSASALAFSRLLPHLPVVYTLHHVRDEKLSAFYRHFRDANYIAISAEQARREEPLPHVDVIHHGLDASVFEWTSTPDDYVCFIGRFAPVKGLPAAVDAAARAGVPIAVAGSTHEVDVEYGEREVAPRLEQSHVRYLGLVNLSQKIPLLREARALLAPIDWDEPFGLVLIEAMLSGCPVVAYPRGSVKELVEPGITGFIVESVSELEDVIRRGGPLDSFDRARCRERAVERFDRSRMVEDHERLFRRVSGASGRHRAAGSSQPALEAI